jgi:hypothetical protein
VSSEPGKSTKPMARAVGRSSWLTIPLVEVRTTPRVPSALRRVFRSFGGDQARGSPPRFKLTHDPVVAVGAGFTDGRAARAPLLGQRVLVRAGCG